MNYVKQSFEYKSSIDRFVFLSLYENPVSTVWINFIVAIEVKPTNMVRENDN